jgi:hypothetical protein
MLPEDVHAFIKNYTEGDEPRIRFAWNGQHAEEFEDANVEFREAVNEAVLADLDAAPILLIRDLYRAETEYSAEAWCISGDVGRLGERLLRDPEDRFVEDYLIGKDQSFDAHAGTDFVVDRPLVEHLIAVVREKLLSETDAEKIERLHWGEETFRGWLDRREAAGD